jgi:hypothetical protein
MSTALVVNCSAPHYNLGAAKLANWLRAEGWQVATDTHGPGLFADDYDLVALSVIFSWHAPKAAAVARECRDRCEVWCGGPGMFHLAQWWERETGLQVHRGLDQRFERQRGEYTMTFASRGCPVGCYFCIVPRLEGTEFTLDWDFQPAPVLCDNNLSALPAEFQEHIIRRYCETSMDLKDANSGFEPEAFTEETYRRWRAVLRGPWRFAFDTTSEAPAVQRMMEILKAEPARKKRVYVLIGNEPRAACFERIQRVLEWGGEPYCQPMLPLNALSKDDLKEAYGWTRQQLRDVARWTNRFLWRSVPLEEYRPRQGEPPPFAALKRSLVFPMTGGVA